MFDKVTKGALSGKAGEKAQEEFKINGQYVNTPEKGVVGIPFFDEYVEKAAIEYLDSDAQVGHAILHERQLHEDASAEHAASRLHRQIDVQEQVSPTRWSRIDARIGHIMDKVRELGDR